MAATGLQISTDLTDLTEDDLDQLLLVAGTGWEADGTIITGHLGRELVAQFKRASDALLVAKLVDLLPRLVAELDALRERVKRSGK